MRVDEIAAQLPPSAWQRYRILEGSEGPLVADFAAIRAVAVRDRLPAQEVWVVLRRKVDGPPDVPELKYYLSNAPADTPLDTLVWVSGRRWPSASCLAEGKGEVGLDHDEVRFWPGWHHHMTLVVLAHHVLVRLQQRLDQREGGRRPERSASRPAASDHGPSGADVVPGHPAGDPGLGQPAPACASVAPERGRGAPAAARPAAPTSTRPQGGGGAAAVSATPQARGVLVPPQAPTAAP